MKPFSLDEYLKNPSKKVVTKEGKTVKRILCTDARGNYPIVALIEEGCYDNALSYTKDGKWRVNESTRHDLFFAPEKHEGWVNVIRDMVHNEVYCGNMIYASKEEAERIANNATLATAKIEWEEVQ